jgi:uncharacterized protein YdeI (YjbR/CyaY-like superfamily)
MTAEPRFFASQKAWRTWLEKNHAKAEELLVGFHKVGTGKGGLTYKQAVDEALAFGWIDAVRGGGDSHWTIRFTRRKAKSIWSQVNIKRAKELIELGRMHASGREVFDGRDEKLTNRYSFENKNAAFSSEQEKTFRANKAAWAWFEQAPRSYRHPATWWVVSAKKEETRVRRLAQLIEDSAAGRKLRALTPPRERQ